MMGLYPFHRCQEAVMSSIPRALRRFKANVADALPQRTVEQLAAELSRTCPNFRSSSPFWTISCP
jgi:hypothetical protein